jgi:hypothetical protein
MNLTNFSITDLNYMIGITKTQHEIIVRTMVRLEVTFEDHVFLHESTRYKELLAERDVCERWLTQLYAAQTMVTNQEIINSN